MSSGQASILSIKRADHADGLANYTVSSYMLKKQGNMYLAQHNFFSPVYHFSYTQNLSGIVKATGKVLNFQNCQKLC
jgi:hypothetical protein